MDQRILFDIGLILVVGLLGGALFTRFKLPAVVGIILAGIALSPFSPGYSVNANEDILLIGQIGAILIMFTIGLTFDYRFLNKIGWNSFLLAAIASTVAFLAGFFLGSLLGLPVLESMLIGIFFISTSTMVSLKIIEEMNLKKYKNADVLGAAIVIDDIFGFLALTVFISEAGVVNQPSNGILLTTFTILVAVLSIFIIGVKVVPVIFSHADKHMKNSALTIAVAFCLFLSYAVVNLGISPLIGAFLAGTILTSSISHRNILAELSPLRHLFGSVFFVTIGLTIDPTLIASIIWLVIIYSIGALISKAAAAAITLHYMGTPVKDALMLGMATGPRAEVLLIIAQTAVISSIVSPEYMAIATGIVLLTSISTPIAIKTLKRFPNDHEIML